MNHSKLVRRQNKAKHSSENPLTVYPLPPKQRAWPKATHRLKFHFTGFETELNYVIFIFQQYRTPPPSKRGTSRAFFLHFWWLGRSLHAGIQGPMRRARSPFRQSKSSSERSRSPCRHLNSPRRPQMSSRRRSRSPRKHSNSSQRCSPSPRRHSESPQPRSRSPRKHLKSP